MIRVHAEQSDSNVGMKQFIGKLKSRLVVRRSEETAKEAPILTFTRPTRTQERPKNTADAVLRPGKGGLRSSVTE